MTYATCLGVKRDNNRNIVQYIIKINNRTVTVEKNKLKSMMQSGQIVIDNARL